MTHIHKLNFGQQLTDGHELTTLQNQSCQEKFSNNFISKYSLDFSAR